MDIYCQNCLHFPEKLEGFMFGNNEVRRCAVGSCYILGNKPVTLCGNCEYFVKARDVEPKKGNDILDKVTRW